MTCRSCGAQIADKAIVCYRCGTPTAAETVPVSARGRGRPNWGLVMLLVALAGACGWLIPHAPEGSWTRWAAWGGLVVLVLAAAGAAVTVRRR